ncbi:MAG TPA: hypothetical protein VL326_09495 [Kofleriaceae bacterium]|nr:hypothetical protein [Kofleriaceae bacterium]
MRARYWLLGLLAAALFACGHNGGSNNNGSGDPDANSGLTDGMVILGDGMFGGTCTAGSAQCADCVDNDMDGKIDGFDPECTGPADNDESSFATGIPGDNIDATYQDCFFDGNSGAGNDGCNQHVCCLLQAGGATADTSDDIAACMALAPQSNYDKYDRTKCYKPFGSTNVPPKCTMNCGPLAPPGCDCFGCCTICDATGCADVLINPAVSPNCDQTNVTDPGPDGTSGTADDPCKKCVKNMDCGSPTCGGATCILCPGQDPSTLPSSCSGQTCPTGITACDAMGACPAETYCSNGCCIGAIL